MVLLVIVRERKKIIMRFKKIRNRCFAVHLCIDKDSNTLLFYYKKTQSLHSSRNNKIVNYFLLTCRYISFTLFVFFYNLPSLENLAFLEF